MVMEQEMLPVPYTFLDLAMRDKRFCTNKYTGFIIIWVAKIQLSKPN